MVASVASVQTKAVIGKFWMGNSSSLRHVIPLAKKSIRFERLQSLLAYNMYNSDDSYCVFLYGNDHDHPLTWRLFPYFGNLSKRNAQRLLKSKQWYEN